MGLTSAIFKGVGALFGGKKKAKTTNATNQYATDQARRDYEARMMAEQEDDQRKLDGIDFLESVAQGKGYNIPKGAFEALKRRGVYKGMDPKTRILDRPKESYGFTDALGEAATSYGESVAAAERQAIAQGAYPGASAMTGAPAVPTMDGAAGGDDMDILEYYKSLLPPADEVTYTPGVSTSGRR